MQEPSPLSMCIGSPCYQIYLKVSLILAQIWWEVGANWLWLTSSIHGYASVGNVYKKHKMKILQIHKNQMSTNFNLKNYCLLAFTRNIFIFPLYSLNCLVYQFLPHIAGQKKETKNVWFFFNYFSFKFSKRIDHFFVHSASWKVKLGSFSLNIKCFSFFFCLLSPLFSSIFSILLQSKM